MYKKLSKITMHTQEKKIQFIQREIEVAYDKILNH